MTAEFTWRTRLLRRPGRTVAIVGRGFLYSRSAHALSLVEHDDLSRGPAARLGGYHLHEDRAFREPATQIVTESRGVELVSLWDCQHGVHQAARLRDLELPLSARIAVGDWLSDRLAETS